MPPRRRAPWPPAAAFLLAVALACWLAPTQGRSLAQFDLDNTPFDTKTWVDTGRDVGNAIDVNARTLAKDAAKLDVRTGSSAQFSQDARPPPQPAKNTPADAQTWKETAKDAKKAVDVNAGTLADDAQGVVEDAQRAANVNAGTLADDAQGVVEDAQRAANVNAGTLAKDTGRAASGVQRAVADAQYAADINARTAAADVAKTETRVTSQFTSWADGAARSAPAKAMAAAIEAAGVAEDKLKEAERAVAAIQAASDKAGTLWDQLQACGASASVVACAEPAIAAYKELYRPLADALVENSCDHDGKLEDFVRGPPRWEYKSGPPIWDSKVGAGLFLAVFPGGQGAAVDLMLAEIRKQGENVEKAFEQLGKSVRCFSFPAERGWVGLRGPPLNTHHPTPSSPPSFNTHTRPGRCLWRAPGHVVHPSAQRPGGPGALGRRPGGTVL